MLTKHSHFGTLQYTLTTQEKCSTLNFLLCNANENHPKSFAFDEWSKQILPIWFPLKKTQSLVCHVHVIVTSNQREEKISRGFHCQLKTSHLISMFMFTLKTHAKTSSKK